MTVRTMCTFGECVCVSFLLSRLKLAEMVLQWRQTIYNRHCTFVQSNNIHPFLGCKFWTKKNQLLF